MTGCTQQAVQELGVEKCRKDSLKEKEKPKVSTGMEQHVGLMWFRLTLPFADPAVCGDLCRFLQLSCVLRAPAQKDD